MTLAADNVFKNDSLVQNKEAFEVPAGPSRAPPSPHTRRENDEESSFVLFFARFSLTIDPQPIIIINYQATAIFIHCLICVATIGNGDFSLKILRITNNPQ